MLNTRQNYHKSILPRLGSIGYLIIKRDIWGDPVYYLDRHSTWQCVSYPLCDNILPWSRGIHTANFRCLNTGKVVNVSGFYFEEIS